MKVKKSLPPKIYSDSRVIILGSMPGEESLRKQEYYGFPQNAFWRLIAGILGVEVPTEYPLKMEMLKQGGIGLWDVIESCLREGSLDSGIRDEKANPIDQVLKEYPGIRAVFFNGGKAASSFKKRFGFGLLEEREVFYSVLPSSSPAHTVGFDRKLEQWEIIKGFL